MSIPGSLHTSHFDRTPCLYIKRTEIVKALSSFQFDWFHQKGLWMHPKTSASVPSRLEETRAFI